MSRTLLFATVALMLGSTVADAQEQSRQRPGGDRPGMTRPSPGSDNGPRPVVRPPGNGGPQVQPPRPGRPEIQPPRPGNGGPQIQPPRPGNGGPQIQPPRPGNGGPQIQPPRPGNGGRPPIVRPPRPPHGGWNRPPISAPYYRYPRGYNYRRFNIGLLLPSVFLSSVYYYSDYGLLGLGKPPKNYRWVRYGPDLLLVHKRTGRIRDVRYDVFR